ncbi:MAG: hypothetical protein IT445_12760 [Phycisphaeraceae bacterium]|nr:hypothetical protein [Phycisphaeraceae bacterium]
MSSIESESATQDVFELVLARPVLTEVGEHPHLVHLWWRAPQQGERVVWVFVDGELVDVAWDSGQRELWLSIDRSLPRRIELVAADADDPSRKLVSSCWHPPVQSAAAVSLVRDETLPVDTHIEVREGEQLLDEAPMWGDGEHRSGFGALFGQGAFGFDAATGPGLGLGELGVGPLGADNFAWRWRREDLENGEHALSLRALSRDGQVIDEPLELEPITIARLPQPPANLQMQDNFTLTWGQS